MHCQSADDVTGRNCSGALEASQCEDERQACAVITEQLIGLIESFHRHSENEATWRRRGSFHCLDAMKNEQARRFLGARVMGLVAAPDRLWQRCESRRRWPSSQ